MINVVISIEGQVGSGKTLIRKLITQLFEQQGFETLQILTTGHKEVISVCGEEAATPSS